MSCRSCMEKAISEHGKVTEQRVLEPVQDYPDTQEGLGQCFACALKHIARARIFFEEYHTGYPMHVKLAVNSTALAEAAVIKAFRLKQQTLAHLDMSACELVGDKQAVQLLSLRGEVIQLANRIRAARLQLEEDALCMPDFDELELDIQRLKYKASGLPA